jgi:hypothetical protein
MNEHDRSRDGLSWQIPGDGQITGIPRPTLRTVKQFCQHHPAFTEGGIRWLLFNRELNGLQKAVVKIGRRLLIDEDAFFAWIDEQKGQ